MRRGGRSAVGLVLSGCVLGGAWIGVQRLETRLAAGVRERAAAHGVATGAIRLSWPKTLEVDDVLWVGPGGERLHVDRLRLTARVIPAASFPEGPAGGLAGVLARATDPRAHVGRVSLRGLRFDRGALSFEWPAVDLGILSWTRESGQERLRLRQRPSGGEIDARRSLNRRPRALALSLSGLDFSQARLSWSGEPVLAPGSWSGRLALGEGPAGFTSEGDFRAEGVRVALPRGPGLGSGAYGAPTPVALAWSAAEEGTRIDVGRLAARVGGLELEARGTVEGPPEDRHVDLAVSTRAELGPALRTAALRLPASLSLAPADGLGTAVLELAVRGPLSRPTELDVLPRLRYDGTAQAAEKLEFLRRPFRYRPEGGSVTLEVRPGHPDFIALGDVPALVLRALLLSEDAGFWGHPGIDVAEIPVAWAVNLERGEAARGASTITQQLVKNLFLSRDKSYGRKLEEAALALLVDAAVPKPRILEIYVNVIEWGPGVYGLVPAARHYFGKAPGELSAKETAFLVCLVPSPIRYHQAHAAGRVGPGMEQLTTNLLAKLLSVDALSVEEYASALDEELVFAPEPVASEPTGEAALPARSR